MVYAIVRNYLAKVKEHRAVGKRVFFQGGVALNRAVACAFAQCLDRPVTIPPHPELLGALGVGLLAWERSQACGTGPQACGLASGAGGVDLNALAAPAMSVVGQFTCRACGNHCSIERFEVAGRRFPFGGRCSRFEPGEGQAGQRRGGPGGTTQRDHVRSARAAGRRGIRPGPVNGQDARSTSARAPSASRGP